VKRLQTPSIPLPRHEPATAPKAQPVQLRSPAATATRANQMSFNHLFMRKSTHYLSSAEFRLLLWASNKY